MLNLSEEGCGFQAITPVKMRRNALRISDQRRTPHCRRRGNCVGRRVRCDGRTPFYRASSGSAQRNSIVVEETNAPMEYGYASAAAASAAAAGAGVGARPNRVNVPPPVAPDPFPPSARSCAERENSAARSAATTAAAETCMFQQMRLRSDIRFSTSLATTRHSPKRSFLIKINSNADLHRCGAASLLPRLSSRCLRSACVPERRWQFADLVGRDDERQQDQGIERDSSR